MELTESSYMHLIGTNLEKITQLSVTQSSQDIDVLCTPPTKVSAYTLENDIAKKFLADFFLMASNTTILTKDVITGSSPDDDMSL